MIKSQDFLQYCNLPYQYTNKWISFNTWVICPVKIKKEPYLAEYTSILNIAQLIMKYYHYHPFLLTSVQYNVRNKFKSYSYSKLCKDYKEVSDSHRFDIIQNSNQKFDLKKSGLIIRNRFSYQRYMTYKSDKKYHRQSEKTGKCQRTYSSRSIIICKK